MSSQNATIWRSAFRRLGDIAVKTIKTIKTIMLQIFVNGKNITHEEIDKYFVVLLYLVVTAS